MTEKVSAGNLFVSSFIQKIKTLPPVLGALSTLRVKKYRLGLQNHLASSAEKYNSLLHARCELIGTANGKKAFSTANHIWAVKEDRRDSKNIVTSRMVWNPMESLAARAPSRNAFSSVPSKWVTG